jgi:hypothetical protein
LWETEVTGEGGMACTHPNNGNDKEGYITGKMDLAVI